MHSKIVWQGRDYTINPSSHLQGWAWREQNRKLRHSEYKIIWSKNIFLPPPPLINVHQDTSTNIQPSLPSRQNPKLWFYCSSLIISPFYSQFTLRSCHTLPLLFSILEHISPPPMLRDPWTVCADDYRDGGDYSGFSLHWLQLLQLSVTPHCGLEAGQRPAIIRLLTNLPAADALQGVPKK